VLLRLPLYRKMVLLAMLILGSHAMHDSFAMIRWSRAGISPGTSGILWALSVAAEVVVFLLVGRPLLDRIGPAGAAMLSAGAGVVRWAVMAETAWLPAVAANEPLHGLTFALLHLTCMRLLAQCVPRHLEATALTNLRYRRHRYCNRSPYACLRANFRALRGARVLGDGGPLCGGVAAHPKPAKPEPNRDFERTPPSAVRAIFG